MTNASDAIDFNPIIGGASQTRNSNSPSVDYVADLNALRTDREEVLSDPITKYYRSSD